ncbi:MAG: hypothetical protein KAI64_00455, partial [Thermoplasmata archaeon]|nr:hypothetical protein [Thermoplasmata archaeon]
MKPRLKIIIAAVVISACLVIATSYIIIDSPNNGDINSIAYITALEALNYSDNYMESKYEEFNLSSIWSMSFRYGGAPSWEIKYVINNGSWLTRERVYVRSNGTISPYTISHEIEYLLSYYEPVDLYGCDGDLVKIDSDLAFEIINARAEEELCYGEPMLRLETSYFQ